MLLMKATCEQIASVVIGPPVRRSGAELLWHCPQHRPDEHPSLSINPKKDVFMCGPCGAQGNAWELAAFLAGVSPNDKRAITAWLREHGLMQTAKGKRVAEYIYTDADGNPVGKVVRWEPKSFHQECPDGNGGWKPGGFPRTLYRLPEVLKAEFFLIVEGEADAEAGKGLGFTATTSGNAGSWKAEHAKYGRAKSVCVIVDKDEKGRSHARTAAKSLVGIAASVRMLELPGEKVKDLRDWIRAGGTKEQLLKLVKGTPELKPEDVAEWGGVKSTPHEPKCGEPSKLRAVSLGDFLTLEIPPREMFLSPVIAAQSLNLLYGLRGIGKTHVTLAIALSVAGGTRFLRWAAPKPRRVLYIDGELPASLLQQWTAELVAGGSSEAATENLRFITPDLQEGGIPDLATTLGQAAIAEHCEWADLIIVDNLSSLVREGRENESESWLPVQAWALELRRRGKSVLFVHHAARNGQNQRGTSKREDLLDTILGLKRPTAYSQTEGLRAEIHFEKCRAFHGNDAEPFEVALVTSESGLPTWTVAAIQTSQFERAQPLLEAGADIATLMQELGVSRASAFRLKKKYRQSQSQASVN